MRKPLQVEFPELHSSREAELSEAVSILSSKSAEERGAIYTRREVVDFILDLVGYSARRDLSKFRLLEPSFGHGEFLESAIVRLIKSASKKYRASEFTELLTHSITGIELNSDSMEATRGRLLLCMQNEGVPTRIAGKLLDRWLIQGDFLLAQLDSFSHVVGNPPYVRQENLSAPLLAEYRRRFHTIYDRADLYVPFIEKGLLLLRDGGNLGYICADRWMRNKYGGPLRRFIANQFSLKYYVDMVGVDAFHSEVSAYPGIFVISTGRQERIRTAKRPVCTADELGRLAKRLTASECSVGEGIWDLPGDVLCDGPWPLDCVDDWLLVKELERKYPSLDDAGCKVGIGVATGADRVFVRKKGELKIENDRVVPLVLSSDLCGLEIQWSEHVVINPFENSGDLVSLKDYPKLRSYFENHLKDVKGRNVARKNPSKWYRTIDRIYPELRKKEKLLIPDIKGEAQVVYDAGQYYPHHNLYFVTSDSWPLKPLQAILRSSIARLFISVYSTKMRGDYLRFQAQYLRKIRIPEWRNVPVGIKTALKTVAECPDIAVVDQVVFDAYGIKGAEAKQLQAHFQAMRQS